MKTITAKLPDNLADAINAAAEDNKASKSDIIRDILSRYLIDGDKMPERDDSGDIKMDNIDQKINNLSKDIDVLRAQITQQSNTIADIANNLTQYSKVMVQTTLKCFLVGGFLDDAKIAKVVQDVTEETNRIFTQKQQNQAPRNNQQVPSRPLGGVAKGGT